MCFTQDLSYVHYDTKDGLAGSTVYFICQDKNGFIWFATETGLSRYDGKNFRNYTVNDGLPDNEILKVFADSRGRVWILPFKKAICYYYCNKIYTNENDSLLKKIKSESNILEISEDEDQNLILSDTRKVIFISKDGNVIDINKPNLTNPNYVSARKNYFQKGFSIRINDSLFSYYNGSLEFDRIDSVIFDRSIVPLVTYPKDNFRVKIPFEYISYENDNNHVTFINTYNGSFFVDTVNKAIGQQYLPGKKISKTFNDKEKNIWFSTLGEGVYKLPSKEIRTINFINNGKIENTEVFSLSKHEKDLVCGLGFCNTFFIKEDKIFKTLNFKQYLGNSLNPYPANRTVCIKSLSTGEILLGFDSYLIKLENHIPSVKNIFPIKSVEEINKDYAIVGTSSYAFKLRVSDLQITDTIWIGRCTKVAYAQNKYYIGTLNGLYEVTKSKEKIYLGDKFPELKGRITDIKLDADQSMFISTADNGVVILKNDQLIRSISEKDGLSSNICRTLFLSGNDLFVGTNKGLNKISITNKELPIVKYTTSDGLPSDIINAVYAEKDTIWVGTPAGLTYFNEKDISSTSICNSILLSISVSGKERSMDSTLTLSYFNNNITFEYAGISFKTGKDIEYYYKLDGLDTSWNKTKETTLTYKSLPYGNYKFQLYAINKFGLKSNVINVSFFVSRPFWKNPWLLGAVFCGILLLSIWFINKRNQRILSSRDEQNKIQRQFAALEQQALQAQINPHFIFNCLNSIQQYILTNDKEKANQFLTGFASLVRQTLDISEKRTVSLSEEIDYLSKYLQMEKMRFGDNFNYEIIVDKSISPEMINIPTLLFQPYVENSLRHGIRYKEHGTGLVTISFSLNNDILICCIKDNGIGRKKAAEYKSKQHIEYQSKGMKLTEKRIDLINKINKSSIATEITDLTDNEGNGIGTEVKIKIPLYQNA